MFSLHGMRQCRSSPEGPPSRCLDPPSSVSPSAAGWGAQDIEDPYGIHLRSAPRPVVGHPRCRPPAAVAAIAPTGLLMRNLALTTRGSAQPYQEDPGRSTQLITAVPGSRPATGGNHPPTPQSTEQSAAPSQGGVSKPPRAACGPGGGGGGGVPPGCTQIVPKWHLADRPAGTDCFNTRARRDAQQKFPVSPGANLGGFGVLQNARKVYLKLWLVWTHPPQNPPPPTPKQNLLGKRQF